MDWQECNDKKFVKEVGVDESLIESLVKSSEKRFKSNDRLDLDETTASTKISIIYESLREVLEAVAIKKGFKIYQKNKGASHTKCDSPLFLGSSKAHPHTDVWRFHLIFEDNHECFCSFLKEVCDEENFSKEFDKFRRIRNLVNYYGKDVDVQDVDVLINEIIKLRVGIVNKFLK